MNCYEVRTPLPHPYIPAEHCADTTRALTQCVHCRQHVMCRLHFGFTRVANDCADVCYDACYDGHVSAFMVDVKRAAEWALRLWRRAAPCVAYEMMFVDRCVSVCEPSFVVSRDRQITMWSVGLCSCVDACFVQSSQIKVSESSVYKNGC